MTLGEVLLSELQRGQVLTGVALSPSTYQNLRGSLTHVANRTLRFTFTDLHVWPDVLLGDSMAILHYSDGHIIPIGWPPLPSSDEKGHPGST